MYCGEAGIIKSVDVYCGEAGGYAGGEVGGGGGSSGGSSGVVVLVLVLVCSGYSGTPKSSMGARQIGQMGFTLCQFPTHLEWNR